MIKHYKYHIQNLMLQHTDTVYLLGPMMWYDSHMSHHVIDDTFLYAYYIILLCVVLSNVTISSKNTSQQYSMLLRPPQPPSGTCMHHEEDLALWVAHLFCCWEVKCEEKRLKVRRVFDSFQYVRVSSWSPFESPLSGLGRGCWTGRWQPQQSNSAPSTWPIRPTSMTVPVNSSRNVYAINICHYCTSNLLNHDVVKLYDKEYK